MNERQPPFGPVTHREREPHRQAHELSRIFADHHLRLNAELESALAEDPEHLEIRRGGGFLQASRMLAEFINRPRSRADIHLFDSELVARRRTSVADLDDEFDDALYQDERLANDQAPLVDDVRPLQTAVRALQFQESHVLGEIITDLVGRYQPGPHDQVLFSENPDQRFAAAVPTMGTCTTAETYFLEFAYHPGMFKWRGGDSGYMNVIVDDAGNPLMLEKIGIGDPHSAITVQEIVLHNVRLPAGTLLGVGYNPQAITKQPLPIDGYDRQRFVKGQAGSIKASECGGFKYLRLSSLTVEPERRAAALDYLLRLQKESSFPMAERAEIDVLYYDALKMLNHPDQTAELERQLDRINRKRAAKGLDSL
jgi:hypothetical protein